MVAMTTASMRRVRAARLPVSFVPAFTGLSLFRSEASDPLRLTHVERY